MFHEGFFLNLRGPPGLLVMLFPSLTELKHLGSCGDGELRYHVGPRAGRCTRRGSGRPSRC